MERFWNEICAAWQLGLPLQTPRRVTGGYMHRMYRLDTPVGSYAVKLLNPEVMARPEAVGNYLRAAQLETVLERAGLPIVPALQLDGRKLHRLQEQYYQLFCWEEGKAVPWNELTPEHCSLAGALLAKQHAIVWCTDAEQLPRDPAGQLPQVSPPEPFAFDWHAAVQQAQAQCPQIAARLREALPLLLSAQESYHRAVAALPQLIGICNGDMDCKNVLWRNGQPLVIDLECLAWGNPVADLVQLALDWAGGAVGRLNEECLTAFLKAYRCVNDPGPLDWDALSGLGFAWLDWLNYSVFRACGGPDEETRQTGIQQTLDTLQRIRFYTSARPEVGRLFAAAFAPGNEL